MTDDELRIAVAAWRSLPANHRNNIIGMLIGSLPLTQYWLCVGGARFSPTPYTAADKEKALGMAKFARGNGWEEFAARNNFPTEWRDTVQLELEAWHLRYSDTPGGGWNVIEAIRNEGFSVTVQSCADGWRVTADEVEAKATTMAEAACLAALLARQRAEAFVKVKGTK